jgi:hypothetical protein
MRLIAALFLLLVATPAAAQEWFEAETNNFIIRSRDTEAATRQFAIELERFDMALRTLQNMPIGTEQQSRSTKLTVYRFGDQGDIALMAGAPGSGIAGFYIAQAGDSVAFAPARDDLMRNSGSIEVRNRRLEELTNLNPRTVLKHEYVHYFMMQHFPAAYPRWYVEGYAELLATIRLNPDGSFHVGDAPQHRAYQVFQMSRFPLEEMLDANHRLSGEDAYQHYATGWLLAHYLSFDAERRTQLSRYLAALGQGEDSLAAARSIFGDLKAIDRQLLRYRRGALPGIDVKPADYREPAIELRPMTAVEVALIREEMRLRRGVSKSEGADIAGDVRRKSREFGDDPHALGLLARAELEAKNYPAADAAAERLVQRAPDAILGWLVRSQAAVEQATTDPARARAAREFAVRASELDRADPRPKLAYYYSYVRAGQEAPEVAIIALEEAFATAGSDAGYRILLARQLLIEDRLGDAKTVLLPIAFRGHNQGEDGGGDDDPSTDKLMRLVNAADRDGALAMIDKLLAENEDKD